MEGNEDEIVEDVKERGSGALNWERVMAESFEYPSYSALSPLRYFLSEIKRGNSLRNTTSVVNDKERQRVYNTMFHVPWRCELVSIYI
ncbi:hypothetical protein SUGI_1145720 [Cryptomeria japonica]|nr:hypothetical protein SUGI_1145720 [Cryptomeria japonica]